MRKATEQVGLKDADAGNAPKELHRLIRDKTSPNHFISLNEKDEFQWASEGGVKVL